MDGDHDIARCERCHPLGAEGSVRAAVRCRCGAGRHDPQAQYGVPGKKCAKQNSVEEVAARHPQGAEGLRAAAVPGIAFLSGGQSDLDATAHLSAINAIGSLPWPLTFSYGRALQAAPQAAWSGKAENVASGQAAFAHRALMNSLAAIGQVESRTRRRRLDLPLRASHASAARPQPECTHLPRPRWRSAGAGLSSMMSVVASIWFRRRACRR